MSEIQEAIVALFWIMLSEKWKRNRARWEEIVNLFNADNLLAIIAMINQNGVKFVGF